MILPVQNITDNEDFTNAIDEVLPLSLVKSHLRVQHTVEDELIQFYIMAAVDVAQQYIGKSLLSRFRLVEHSELVPLIKIYDEVESLVYVSYVNPENNRIEYLKNVQLTEVEDVFYVEISVIPNHLKKEKAVRIMYKTSALSSEVDVFPKGVQQAILLMVGQFYEYRENPTWDIPRASERLLNHYIQYSL